MRRALWLGWLAACAAPPTERTDLPGPPTVTARVWVEDLGPSSGYQDFWFGQYNRGRGNVVADFDGDGDFDVFSGNPGGHSFLIRNVTEPGGPLRFEPWQVLSHVDLFYGGVAADFDNDGDPDLFVATGANDGYAFDRLYRNDLGSGAPDDAPLVEVTDPTALGLFKVDGTPVPTGTMGARAFDVNGDALLDLWTSNFAGAADLAGVTPDDRIGLNLLYLNHGDFDLRNAAWALGFKTQEATRHSSVFDFDHDGDFDVYENNFGGSSRLWRNRLVEDGALRFEPVTWRASLGDGASLLGPFIKQAMCSIPVDLDNDGWEDLLLLHRGREVEGAVHHHQVFMNVGGRGFVDVSEHSNLSARFDVRPPVDEDGGPMGTGWGVMGCQVGDVNLDGFPDVFIGTGSAASGDVDRLFVSTERTAVSIDGVGEVAVPQFEEWSGLLDFPAEPVPGAPVVPYPYRTHGSAFADFDGDGVPELSVHNGGPAIYDDLEPNRLWKFHLDDPRFLRVSLRGDGVHVNRDGVGARVRVEVVRYRDGARWELWQTRRAGTGFGAQNEPVLTFGLADADRVVAVEVYWPDGEVQVMDPPDGVRAELLVAR